MPTPYRRTSQGGSNPGSNPPETIYAMWGEFIDVRDYGPKCLVSDVSAWV